MTEQAGILRTNVRMLPPKLKKLVEKMLIEGATFQETVEAVNEIGKDKVTLIAIQSFYRSNLELQARRVRYQLETAETLQKALGDPESGQKMLAGAVVLTGLMRVENKGSEFGVQDAVRGKVQQEKMKNEAKALLLKTEKLEMDRGFTDVRVESELLKMKAIRKKLDELEKTLKSKGKRRQLSPETIQKIREIYGLTSKQSSAPTDKENSTAQA